VVTVALASGKGSLAGQSLCLIQSLQLFTEVDRIVISIPQSERPEIAPQKLKSLSQHAVINYPPVPIPGYPVSVKASALKHAMTYDDDWYILLDTDILVMDELSSLLNTSGNLRIKPVDIGRNEWAANNDAAWESLYADSGRKWPGRVWRSTVDNQPIPPYWNSGVVMTKDPTLADKWLELTKFVYERYPGEFFVDQISLGILSTDYHVDPLPSAANHPLPHYRWTPTGTKVLHYHDLDRLRRILNPSIRNRVSQTGILKSEIMPSWSQMLRIMAGRFAYNMQNKLGV